ncbi:MAG: hypothetical protein LBV60_00765 [Streptomyces sp.]|jgi:hypothetical protein|nr:hypothetical protein [Streptomyces sp.]
MAGQDSYGQGVVIASLTDAPDAESLARNLADALAQRSVMRFASASARAATLTGQTPAVAGMATWLQDVRRLDVYDGTNWLPVGGTQTVASVVGDSYGVTSLNYTTVAASGTYLDCAVAFTAPLSGRVMLHINGRVQNTIDSAAGFLSAQVRTGSAIGSGSIVEDANDSRAIRGAGGSFDRVGITHLTTGLTPGATYNARLLHKTSASTSLASFAHRELIVVPAP